MDLLTWTRLPPWASLLQCLPFLTSSNIVLSRLFKTALALSLSSENWSHGLPKKTEMSTVIRCLANYCHVTCVLLTDMWLACYSHWLRYVLHALVILLIPRWNLFHSILPIDTLGPSAFSPDHSLDHSFRDRSFEKRESTDDRMQFEVIAYKAPDKPFRHVVCPV